MISRVNVNPAPILTDAGTQIAITRPKYPKIRRSASILALASAYIYHPQNGGLYEPLEKGVAAAIHVTDGPIDDLEASRNVITLRSASDVGISRTLSTAAALGVGQGCAKCPRAFSLFSKTLHFTWGYTCTKARWV